MIGRQDELGVLNDLYHSGRFEYLVMYGRRRVVNNPRFVSTRSGVWKPQFRF